MATDSLAGLVTPHGAVQRPFLDVKDLTVRFETDDGIV